jgi:hypothetical protein
MKRFLHRAIAEAPRLLFPSQLRATGAQLRVKAEADTAFADSIAWTASPLREVLPLVIHAHFGSLVLRWYYRIANTCSHPQAAARKLTSAFFST